MISVVVPFSRPQFLHNVIDNFNRQTHQDKRLIVVENGAGTGCFGGLDCTILTSGCHHALARNEAIGWIRKHGGGWWAGMDDDDYYGPNYLAEIAENIPKADVLGKADRFFRNDQRLFLMDQKYEHTYVNSVLGATIAARAEDSCEFQEETHDDWLFSREMIARGARVYATSKFNFIHCRYSDISTSWGIDTDEMAQNAIDVGQRVIQWDGIHLDIVNGTAEISGYTEVEVDRSKPPARLSQQGMSFEDLIRSHGIEPDPELLKGFNA